MSDIKKIEDGKVEITCLVDGDKWKEANKKTFKKVMNKLSIKGFRKGQVPENLAKKYINEKEVQLDAASELANDVFEDALKEHEVELIDKASFDLKEIDDQHALMVFTCPVKPDVKLGDYKAIKYDLEECDVTEAEVEDAIKNQLDRKADLELKEDGVVENGDTAVIDFEGFKDGVAFEGGKGENYDLVIGSNSFIPGFESQLLGMKSDEEKDINVTFPEDYHVEALKAAPVVFKVKVHEIKKKVLPELNDEFVESLKIENVKNVEEYRQYLKDNILSSKQQEATNKADDKLIKDIISIAEINIPYSMVKDEMDQIYNETAQNFMYQGIAMDQYLKIIGKSENEVKESFKESAIDRIKSRLTLEAIADKENIEVSDEEVEENFNKMSEDYKMSVEDLKKYISALNVKKDIKTSKAFDLLKSNK